jgi:PAS domain-containing protein
VLHALDVIGVGLFAFLGASLIVGVLALWTRAPVAVPAPARRPEVAVYLFEGQRLVDATPAARRALRAQAGGEPDLTKLLRLLGRGFGTDLERRLAGLATGGRLSLASPTGAGILDLAEEGGALRLTLRPDGAGASAIDRLSLDAAREELELLRGLAQDAPHPIWTLGAGGELTWANRAYLALADLAKAPPDKPERAAALRASWPLDLLFEPPAGLSEGQLRQERLPLAPPDGEEPFWYDVTSVRRGAGSLHFATDVSSLVQAETARLHFVQTLVKTFAQLSTGLAVFDRDRRLVVFNPAFVDLTGLPIDFLSDRPLVQAVLDRLRDARILPEPRDYAAWRERVAALEAAAAEGHYCENWTLPGGQTYRVTGRPHPDGALAFLFEDISGEVGLARRVRTELDTTRDVLDALGDAMAAFSPTGALTLSNAGYAALWGPPAPDTDLAGEAARWESASLPSSVWARLRGPRSEDAAPSEEEVRLPDGRALVVLATALPHGAVLMRFRTEPAPERPVAKPDRRTALRQAEPA